MPRWMQNITLTRRYGKEFDYAGLNDDQRAFLLDKRVRNNQDPMGNRTVQLVEIVDGELRVTDTYAFNAKPDQLLASTYRDDRERTFGELVGDRTEASDIMDTRMVYAAGNSTISVKYAARNLIERRRSV